MSEEQGRPVVEAQLVGGPDDLGDDTYAELGRLTMAAIHLEGAAMAMCQIISLRAKPGIDGRTVGRMIGDATELLTETGEERCLLVVEWLAVAAAALDRRNRILHGSPLMIIPRSSPTPAPSCTVVSHVSRKTADETVTPLTREDLHDVTGLLSV